MKQVDPAIDHGLAGAPAASVVDHRFGSSDPFTLGVEEEYMLLDPRASTSSSTSTPSSTRSQGDELGDRINAELMQSVLEIATPVCRTAGDVMRELTTLRGYVRDVAANEGLRVGSAGHAPLQPLRAPADHGEGPLPRADRPAPVRRPARADLRDAHPRRGRRPGQGDPGRQRAAAPARAAPRALGELAVLARRADGLASSRQIVFSAFPRSGPPPRFRDYEDYAEVVGQLERTGCIADYTHIWWDIRPHPKWGRSRSGSATR